MHAFDSARNVVLDQQAELFAIDTTLGVVRWRECCAENGDVVRGGLHHAVHPPSITRFAPVMYVEASEARNTIAPLNSSASAMRPIGIREV